MSQKILVTGGAGYIGSHTCVQLLNAGYEPVVLDNLSNSKSVSLERVRQITGRDLIFEQGDVRCRKDLVSVFKKYDIAAVIHFAAFKAVGESVKIPLEYYDNNISGTVTLCEVMNRFGVKNMIFSSSATVYGMSTDVPFTEEAPTSATNPYGRTKLFNEEILKDCTISDPDWKVVCLRYFNPVGAHKSGLIGEDPNGIPNNLMPYIAQVAVGRLPELKVFGSDYPTPDGTGVRDYIHVVDLADGHVRALDYLQKVSGCEIINLGTGCGISVLQMLEAFSRAADKPIPYKFTERRPGDVAESYAKTDKATRLLSWKAKRGVDAMAADTWRWQTKNPNGYE